MYLLLESYLHWVHNDGEGRIIPLVATLFASTSCSFTTAVDGANAENSKNHHDNQETHTHHDDDSGSSWNHYRHEDRESVYSNRSLFYKGYIMKNKKNPLDIKSRLITVCANPLLALGNYCHYLQRHVSLSGMEIFRDFMIQSNSDSGSHDLIAKLFLSYIFVQKDFSNFTF